MTYGFDQEMWMSRIEAVGALPKIGRHVRPVVGLDTPPVWTPAKRAFGCVGMVTPATVRLARKGPISR
jgi:hypothetical protein